jgi:hypothetical protein
LLASRVRCSRALSVRGLCGRRQRGQPGLMTERQRVTPRASALRIAVAGAIVAGGALAMAGQAAADPAAPYPTPSPSDPGAAAPLPGQPVAVPVDAPAGPPPPPPNGAPVVPEVQNPVYGSGQTPGQFGYLRDIWHAFHTDDPAGALTATPPDAGPGAPAGAGPPPPLPPGYLSLTAPESSTGSIPGTGPQPYQGGPALPPGYYPITGPPPPGYDSPPAPDPSAPPELPYQPPQ